MYFLKYQSIAVFSIIFFSYGCNNSVLNKHDNNKQPNYFETINKYSNKYFIGIGTGESTSQEVSLKISKSRALGELADNVKVTIMSKLEMVTSENKIGGKVNISESIREKIISIGNATVRLPEYEILSVTQTENGFRSSVMAKKLKTEHIAESAKDLEYGDDSGLLNDLLN